ncbi:MAG: cytochrome b/b6 domain-containing protein [Caldimonas sp.]
MIDRAPTRYSATGQALHWLTAILVLIAFVYGPGGTEQRVYASARDFDRQLHETLGIAVLGLLALRILWRLVDTRPELPQGARWMEIASKVVHASLYSLLFAVPLTAIAGAWLEGHPLTLLGGVLLSPWFSESHALGAKVADVHTWLGDTLVWLAGAHALAGLAHHYVLKDDVLRTMLPRRFARRPRRRAHANAGRRDRAPSS